MDGVFPFLKPPGITSHDAVAICRRLLGERRIGHSGTLDPLAYGVLPMFLGKATRLIEYTEDAKKTYVSECQLGIQTDTEDITGLYIEELEENSIPSYQPTFEELSKVIVSFVGPQKQVPSKYSAIKINGKKAYELARAGIEFELPPRDIEIYEATLLAYSYPYFTMRVTCSGGTYIRALVRDICKRLNTIGTMTQLCRTQVGDFFINDAITAEEIESKHAAVLLPSDRCIYHLNRLDVNDIERTRLIQGKQIKREVNELNDSTLLRAYSNDQFIGVMRWQKGIVLVEKNIFIE